jgi:hypothetical protein
MHATQHTQHESRASASVCSGIRWSRSILGSMKSVGSFPGRGFWWQTAPFFLSPPAFSLLCSSFSSFFPEFSCPFSAFPALFLSFDLDVLVAKVIVRFLSHIFYIFVSNVDLYMHACVRASLPVCCCCVPACLLVVCVYMWMCVR